MNELSYIFEKMQTLLFPELNKMIGPLTEKEKSFTEMIELVKIEDYVTQEDKKTGRPSKDKKSIARAFLLKSFYNLNTTKGLLELLKTNVSLRMLCCFESVSNVPSESTASRVFAEFAEIDLGEKVHTAIISRYHGEKIVGHISRDATAIPAREKGKTYSATKEKQVKKVKGEKIKGEKKKKKTETVTHKQREQSLEEMLNNLPIECDTGTKINSKGYKTSWKGYKLHLDTADTGVPISAIITSASVHDSQAAIPLMEKTKNRVTNFYDLMDSAYDDINIKEHISSLGHVGIIDHNPRRGVKKKFEPATKIRYKERTTAERANARLKDDFGCEKIRVKGFKKVSLHLMFSVIVLVGDQLLRLLQ